MPYTPPPRALTNDEARTIRYLRAAGASQKELSEIFKVSQALISMIVTGRKYHDAGGPRQIPRAYRKNVRK